VDERVAMVGVETISRSLAGIVDRGAAVDHGRWLLLSYSLYSKTLMFLDLETTGFK